MVRPVVGVDVGVREVVMLAVCLWLSTDRVFVCHGIKQLVFDLCICIVIAKRVCPASFLVLRTNKFS